MLTFVPLLHHMFERFFNVTHFEIKNSQLFCMILIAIGAGIISYFIEGDNQTRVNDSSGPRTNRNNINRNIKLTNTYVLDRSYLEVEKTDNQVRGVLHVSKKQ